jgi:hypothetical protein
MFAKQALSTDPDQRTLLGKEGAQNVLDQVRCEVEKAG